ncbi:MAG: hypothetical protein N3B11_07365 [Coriobacteriia bacterium]|nr:hypothetical protein [Coriobacteriia bacterium]
MERRRTAWDFALMMATVALLVALGAQSLLGTLYAWWAYRNEPGWEATGYPAFVTVMNAIAAPLAVALVVVMGLCVPKRLFSRRALVAVSAVLVGVGVSVAAVEDSVQAGLTAYLALAALLQCAVVVLTLADAGGLAYMAEGRAAKVGSGLLHLGFVVFALTVVALQSSSAMLPAFVASALLLAGGSALSFYSRGSSSERSGTST